MSAKSPARISRKANPRTTSRGALFETLENRRLLTSVVVNTTVDAIFPPSTGLISLRSAIATANASTSPTTITFSPTVFATPETILLNGNDLPLTNTSKAITITGPAVGVTVSGNNASAVFQIASGVTASLSNLAITKASAGGIGNSGTLTLTDDEISGNASYENGGEFGGGSNDGGGIANYGSLFILDSTISGNADTGTYDGYPSGGGIYDRGTLTMTNSTVEGNSNEVNGGGIEVNGGTLTIYDSTVSQNTTSRSGGGINVDSGGVVNIANTIVANDTAGVAPDVEGNFASIGYNLIGKTDGSAGFNTLDLTGTVAKPLSAKLGALANNGGLTETMLPASGSPAIGAGLVAYVPKGVTTDQRGLPRTVSGKVDIGAVEVQPTVGTGSIAGTVFADANGNGKLDAGEKGLANVKVFLDTNDDGILTTGEPTVTTSSTGAFKFTGLLAGTYHVREILPAGYIASAPLTAETDVKLTTGQASTSTLFADAPPATISGRVFADSNGNGIRDKGELGLGDWVVYIDLTNKGSFVTGDPTATTDVNGNWSFTGLLPGTYTIRVEPVAGTKATTPAALKLTIKAGSNTTGNLFGEESLT